LLHSFLRQWWAGTVNSEASASTEAIPEKATKEKTAKVSKKGKVQRRSTSPVKENLESVALPVSLSLSAAGRLGKSGLGGNAFSKVSFRIVARDYVGNLRN